MVLNKVTVEELQKVVVGIVNGLGRKEAVFEKV
jgi:hypothetical protein